MSHESESAKRAPDDLELVQRFVNTVELDEGPEDDELTDPDTLVAWFAERGLCEPGARATQAELERAIVVREGLRAVLDGHNGGEPDPDAVAALEAATDHASLRASFTGEQPGADPGVRRHRCRPGPAAGRRDHRGGRRELAAAQGLRRRGVPLGLLRPLAEPVRAVVLDGDLRQPAEGADVPRARPGGQLIERGCAVFAQDRGKARS